MRKLRIKRPIYKWIQLDSQLEYDIFKAFDDKTIHTLPWLEELKWYKIIESKLNPYIILPAFSLWTKKFRALEYTPDFIIKKWKEEIVLEVKSSWSWKKPDYKLRMKMFLHKYWKEVKFAELVKYNNKKYIYTKYF